MDAYENVKWKTHGMKLVIHGIVTTMENNMKAGGKLAKILTSWWYDHGCFLFSTPQGSKLWSVSQMWPTDSHMFYWNTATLVHLHTVIICGHFMLELSSCVMARKVLQHFLLYPFIQSFLTSVSSKFLQMSVTLVIIVLKGPFPHCEGTLGTG